jgi:ornithine cyclodeaminase
LAEKIETTLGIPTIVGDLQQVVDASIVVTTTPARAPVLVEERLNPGALLIAMGSDAIGKRELSSAIVEQADALVPDSNSQCAEIGELQWRSEWKKTPRIQPLGDVISQRSLGRQSSEDIIIFDSTGLGFQDLVGAQCVLAKLDLPASFGDQRLKEKIQLD